MDVLSVPAIICQHVDYSARIQTVHNPNPVKRDFSEYSKAELDKSLSFIHPKNGDYHAVSHIKIQRKVTVCPL